MTIEKLQQTETLDPMTQELLDDPQAFDAFMRDFEKLYPDEVASYRETQDGARSLYVEQRAGITSRYNNERDRVSNTSQLLASARREESRLKRATLAHKSNTLDA